MCTRAYRRHNALYVQHFWSQNKPAVLANEDEHAAILNHALVQARRRHDL
jgi:predicted amidohydrolase YtcJ